MNTFRIFTWCIVLSSFISLLGCKDEKELNLNFTEVKALQAPQDNLYVKINASDGVPVSFQWDRARAEDGSLVVYEVVFDQENGDFSNPFYTIPSDENGIQSELTLSHSELDKVAAKGGAKFLERKKYKWTVLASKGSNLKLTGESRIIDLERPEAKPDNIYLTGSATEGGTELSSALQMKRTANGKFEIYTKLVAGNYKLVDATSGDINTFSISGTGNSLTLANDGETTYSGADKTFRIRVDFNNRTAEIEEVKSVGLWYSAGNSVAHTLEYAGMGVWRKDNVTLTLINPGWGLEERHKYKVVMNDGTNDYDEWWGYKTNDSPGQDGKYGDDATYLYAFPVDNSQWDWTWKFDRTYMNGKTLDFVMKFSYGSTPYASDYIVKN